MPADKAIAGIKSERIAIVSPGANIEDTLADHRLPDKRQRRPRTTANTFRERHACFFDMVAPENGSIMGIESIEIRAKYTVGARIHCWLGSLRGYRSRRNRSTCTARADNNMPGVRW